MDNYKLSGILFGTYFYTSNDDIYGQSKYRYPEISIIHWIISDLNNASINVHSIKVLKRKQKVMFGNQLIQIHTDGVITALLVLKLKDKTYTNSRSSGN